jgi:hypothetical protein
MDKYKLQNTIDIMFDLLKFISRSTRLVFFISVIIILYGYLCRLVGIYFLWESLPIGWNLFFISIILLLLDLIKNKKPQNKPVILEKIGIGVLIFLMVVEGILLVTVPNTNAWQAAKKYISNDQEIKREIGNIKGFSIIPVGQMAVSSGPEGESGIAEIHFTVKGSSKYKDITLYLEKGQQVDWQVLAIE